MTSAALLEELLALRAEVEAEAGQRLAAWEPRLESPMFRPSAANLARYLALRTRDVRPLQEELAVRGLSSLGRIEARVQPQLEAVILALAALSHLRPAGLPEPPRRRSHGIGARLIERGAARLFGPARPGRTVRIMPTLGAEAAEEPSIAARLHEAGADAFRINCSHDGPEEWARMAQSIRALPGRPKILMDLCGPKLRVAEARGGRLYPGGELLIVRRIDKGRPLPQAVLNADVLPLLVPGQAAAYDDGRMRMTVAAAGDGEARLRVDAAPEKGAKLKAEKGLNLPGVPLPLPALTEKDLADLDFAAAHADVIGLSFVRRAEDLAWLQEELARRAGPDWRRLAVLAKVETAEGVARLPEIIVQGAGRQPMGVMIARGDLAVELGSARTAEIQEEILWLCEAAHVPVVWATQVLESLVKTGLPTRGEATDSAMAQRAECVMLNKGPFAAEGVRYLDDMTRRMAGHQQKKTPRLRRLRVWDSDGFSSP